MEAILHDACPGATGQPLPAVSGNSYSDRPTRLEPLACDCCNRPVGYFDVVRMERGFPFGSLKYLICRECIGHYPAGEPEALTLRWIVTRAGRFGQQWQDAVRAQLGWRA